MTPTFTDTSTSTPTVTSTSTNTPIVNVALSPQATTVIYQGSSTDAPALSLSFPATVASVPVSVVVNPLPTPTGTIAPLEHGVQSYSIQLLNNGTPTEPLPSAQVAITMHYNPSDIVGLVEGALVIYRSDDGGQTWTRLPSTVDPTTHQVTAMTSTFSTFTLAGPSSVQVFLPDLTK